jgi:hypothetical protein
LRRAAVLQPAFAPRSRVLQLYFHRAGSANMATPPLAEQMLAAVIAAKDQALAAKDQVLAAKDQTLAAKDQDLARADQALKFVIDSNTVQIDAYKMRTPQNHLSCLSRAYLVRVAFAEIYQKDLTLSKHMAILHARSVIELTATIFCKNDAKINTHSGMIKKFLNGQVRAAPHACAPYAASP